MACVTSCGGAQRGGGASGTLRRGVEVTRDGAARVPLPAPEVRVEDREGAQHERTRPPPHLVRQGLGEEQLLSARLEVPGLAVQVVLAEVRQLRHAPALQLGRDRDGAPEEDVPGCFHGLDDREPKPRIAVPVDQRHELEVELPRLERLLARDPPIDLPGRPTELGVDAEDLPVLEEQARVCRVLGGMFVERALEVVHRRRITDIIPVEVAKPHDEVDRHGRG